MSKQMIYAASFSSAFFRSVMPLALVEVLPPSNSTQALPSFAFVPFTSKPAVA